MITDAGILFAALLFVAVASGFWLGRRHQRLTGTRAQPIPKEEVFQGMGFLVDEQPDKAIEVLTGMVEVDSQALETHFALGKLFRRRGETGRAIRIHQNIIARPELPPEQRQRAQFSLAEDYLRAGLLDRAEKLFQESAATKRLRQAALTNLVSIYERQKDWLQAIDCRLCLAKESGKTRDAVIAHYYCELAQEQLDGGDLAGARANLRKARAANPRGVRGILMRADLAGRLEDHALARGLLLRVIEQHPQFAQLGISLLAGACRQAGAEEQLPGLLDGLLARTPELALPIAHAAILDRHMDDVTSLRCFEQYLRNDRILGAILGVLESQAGRVDEPASDETLRRIRLVLRRLAMDGPRFGCVECGMTGRSIAWRCQGCLNWDSTLPTANLKFASRLGTVGFMQ